MPAQLLPICNLLLLGQLEPTDTSPWVPLTQWSDIPVGTLVKFVLVPLILAAVVWGVLHYRARLAQASYYSPRRLFNELCAVHGLDWPTRKLLRQLARSRQLEHPALVFLEPTAFDAANLAPAMQAFHAELAQLKSRLF